MQDPGEGSVTLARMPVFKRIVLGSSYPTPSSIIPYLSQNLVNDLG